MVGSFFGPNPPVLSVVQQVVDVHWQTRASIEVKRISDYFIFFCSDERDVLALMKLHITFIDGRILTFRRGHRNLVPRDINFDMATMWVRVSGLSFAYLTPEWTLQTLKHVGHVLDLDFNGDGVPLETDFRACLLIDLSQPLIPGCFLPLDGGQVVWVYFRYEGVFKFCKNCGCVGIIRVIAVSRFLKLIVGLEEGLQVLSLMVFVFCLIRCICRIIQM